mmetsp:Transcript_25120/g.59862  ORF Transcript_25120/g.59862 Transcript_25120/m.59862 type:complete len:105 (-) Transcript_25120:781-1095(-)
MTSAVRGLLPASHSGSGPGFLGKTPGSMQAVVKRNAIDRETNVKLTAHNAAASPGLLKNLGTTNPQKTPLGTRSITVVPTTDFQDGPAIHRPLQKNTSSPFHSS